MLFTLRALWLTALNTGEMERVFPYICGFGSWNCRSYVKSDPFKTLPNRKQSGADQGFVGPEVYTIYGVFFWEKNTKLNIKLGTKVS